MGSDMEDDRAAKRARVEATPLDNAMTATREQLTRTMDPHLQAKLLLQYSAQAMTPTVATEAAIDFLFAFLQQSQSTTNGDQTKSPPGNEGNSNSGNNAVVVAAIVRGLCKLHAVKPHLVEPMIQLDAMSEQLTHCISVSEDFKLRRDMLRIVLDCLIAAQKLEETEQLLRTCLTDHDDRLRAACLDGYARLLVAGHRMESNLTQELVRRLHDILLQCDDNRTRTNAAQVLGMVAETSFDSTSSPVSLLQETILNTLASTVRDPSQRVRLQIAMAFRSFRNTKSPEALYSHLLYKKQISEDLVDIETQSTAMLTSGALVTLLEDDEIEVVVATSTSMRILCEPGLWSSDLIDRAIATHIELAARVGNQYEHVFAVLQNLESFLTLWSDKEMASYSISREELCYLLGSITTGKFAVACRTFAVLQFLAIDTPFKATRVIQFLIHTSQAKDIEATDAATVQSLRNSSSRLVEKWVEQGLVLPPDTLVTLRGVASGTSAKVITETCQLFHDALCRPADRLAVRTTQATAPVPTFLVGS